MKSKLSGCLLIATLCLSASMAVHAAETPEDYAYGMPLITQDSQPFFEVRLPDEVYQQTAWPDMRDLRVFNSQGMTVPFALYSTEAQQTLSKTWPLRVFPMDHQAAGGSGKPQVTLKSAGGIEVTLPVEEAKPSGRSLLLEVPEEGDAFYPRLSGLKLTWARLPQNWQTRVSVLYSDDLKSWNTLVDDAPLMDLTSGSDRLLLDTIDLGYNRHSPHARYLMLVFNDDSVPATLDLRTVTGVETSLNPTQRFVTLAPSVKPLSESEAEYSWSSPQPLSQVKLVPAQSNTVLPLEIEYRSSVQDSWHPSGKTVIYSLGENASAPLALQAPLIQAIRLKGIHQQWGTTPPLVSGEREIRKLVFNAQGSAPYMLVWGNKTAAAQALNLNTLIPPETNRWLALPEAGKTAIQTLGGRARLTATTEAEKSGFWQKGLLWGVLIAGAGGLVILALKVWREVQRPPE